IMETHELLLPHHYGGRPGRSTEDAMMILSENIHQAWKEKKIYTAVYMDIAGAFNNVLYERLIHNLKKRRIPHVISQWIATSCEAEAHNCYSTVQNRNTYPHQPVYHKAPSVTIIIHVL